MSSRRLEDRIRALCAQAAYAPPSEAEEILQELRAALAEYIKRLRKLAANRLTGDGVWKEKRSN